MGVWAGAAPPGRWRGFAPPPPPAAAGNGAQRGDAQRDEAQLGATELEAPVRALSKVGDKLGAA
eukprot:8569281-Pyramimonas_sp.AAC.1